MCPKDVDGIANSVDPDQEQSDLGGSTLFDQTYLSEEQYGNNIKSLVTVITVAGAMYRICFYF